MVSILLMYVFLLNCYPTKVGHVHYCLFFPEGRFVAFHGSPWETHGGLVGAHIGTPWETHGRPLAAHGSH